MIITQENEMHKMYKVNRIESERAKNFKKKTGAMLVAASVLIRVYARQMYAKNGFDITPEQFVILELLVENDGLYQRQLSEITMKDRPNVTRIITILENKGYVQRIEDKNKRKIYKICVTEKGRQEYDSMYKVVCSIRNVMVEGIEKKDMEVCLSVLGKVQDNLFDKVNMQI